MSLAAGLAAAEERLRGHGWTGSRAFDELVEGLKERLGLPHTASRQARRAVAPLPLDTGEDLLGLAYERFFADLFKGRRGQFFTPEPIARLLVSLLDVQPGEVVLDPTCGSGGLLVQAGRQGASLRGIELDPRLAELARLSTAIAGVPAEVRQTDFFATDPVPVDVVVANPPFSVAIADPDVLRRHGVDGTSVSSDVLFLDVVQRWVRPGGRAGVVLPWSLLVNSRFEALRARVDAAWHRVAVCQLPEGVFRPFGGAAGRAGLLWLRRRPCTDKAATSFARVEDPGYDVRSQRYQATDAQEVEDRCQGVGWAALPSGAWVPPPTQGAGRRVGALASTRHGRAKPSAGTEVYIVDLADADRRTGEVHARAVEPASVGSRVAIEPNDVLVARLRPNLGNVARAPEVSGQLAGSPEWVVLVPNAHPGWLLHSLRSPIFRRALPVTGGQTRPRTTPEAVCDVRLRWPGEEVAARVDRVSATLFERRAALLQALERLQETVDRYVGEEIDDEALRRVLSDLERSIAPIGEEGG